MMQQFLLACQVLSPRNGGVDDNLPSWFVLESLRNNRTNEARARDLACKQAMLLVQSAIHMLIQGRYPFQSEDLCGISPEVTYLQLVEAATRA